MDKNKTLICLILVVVLLSGLFDGLALAAPIRLTVSSYLQPYQESPGSERKRVY